jgi:hypothetical protein
MVPMPGVVHFIPPRLIVEVVSVEDESRGPIVQVARIVPDVIMMIMVPNDDRARAETGPVVNGLRGITIDLRVVDGT